MRRFIEWLKRLFGIGGEKEVITGTGSPTVPPPIGTGAGTTSPGGGGGATVIPMEPAPPDTPSDLAPIVEDVKLDPTLRVKVNGQEFRPQLHPGGFSITHQARPLPSGGQITVEVFEPVFVQFMTYPRVGMLYGLTEDDLPGEGHGDISKEPGAFRSVNRSRHYRQVFTSGACKIVMPMVEGRSGVPITIVKLCVNPKPDRPLSTVWIEVQVGTE